MSLVEEHPKSRYQEQHHAFAERVASHVVTVVNRVWRTGTAPNGKQVSEQDTGMGAACCWKSEKLILTAKHVVEHAEPKDLEFFTRLDAPIEWGVRPATPKLVLPTKLKIRRIIRCKQEDLACLVLESNQPFGPLEFLDLPEGLGNVPASGEGTLIHGCPVDQNVPFSASREPSTGTTVLGLKGSPRGCWPVVEGESPKSLPSPFDPENHFLLRYDPAEEGAYPHGFSGSGVWCHRKEDAKVWSANPVLVGIQFAWHRPTKLMFALRPEVIREFLEIAIK